MADAIDGEIMAMISLAIREGHDVEIKVTKRSAISARHGASLVPACAGRSATWPWLSCSRGWRQG